MKLTKETLTSLVKETIQEQMEELHNSYFILWDEKVSKLNSLPSREHSLKMLWMWIKQGKVETVKEFKYLIDNLQ